MHVFPFNFLSIFPGGQLTPFAPMCRHPWLSTAFRRGFTVYPNIAHDAVRDCTKCCISFCTHVLAVANTGKRRGCVPIGIQPFLPVKNTVSHVRQIFTIIGDFLTPPRFAGVGGAYSAPPDPLAGFKRAAFRYRTRGNGGREGREREWTDHRPTTNS